MNLHSRRVLNIYSSQGRNGCNCFFKKMARGMPVQFERVRIQITILADKIQNVQTNLRTFPRNAIRRLNFPYYVSPWSTLKPQGQQFKTLNFPISIVYGICTFGKKDEAGQAVLAFRVYSAHYSTRSVLLRA